MYNGVVLRSTFFLADWPLGIRRTRSKCEHLSHLECYSCKKNITLSMPGRVIDRSSQMNEPLELPAVRDLDHTCSGKKAFRPNNCGRECGHWIASAKWETAKFSAAS